MNPRPSDLHFFQESSTTILGIASGVYDRSVRRGASERPESTTRTGIVNYSKLPLPLRDDISGTGSRIGINENAF